MQEGLVNLKEKFTTEQVQDIITDLTNKLSEYSTIKLTQEHIDVTESCIRVFDCFQFLMDIIAEQNKVIQQYKKADMFLFAHGWRWE